MFQPIGTTPTEDLVAKLTAVKYVIDPGTAKEKTIVFLANGKLFTGLALTGEPIANTITLGTLKPLAVGAHTVEVVWVLSARHRDDLGDDVDANCLGPGDVLFAAIPASPWCQATLPH